MLAERAAEVGRGTSQAILVNGLAYPPMALEGGGEVEMNSRTVAGEGQSLGEGLFGFAETIQLEIDEAQIEQNRGIVGRARREFAEHLLRPLQPLSILELNITV